MPPLPSQQEIIEANTFEGWNALNTTRMSDTTYFDAAGNAIQQKVNYTLFSGEDAVIYCVDNQSYMEYNADERHYVSEDGQSIVHLFLDDQYDTFVQSWRIPLQELFDSEQVLSISRNEDGTIEFVTSREASPIEIESWPEGIDLQAYDSILYEAIIDGETLLLKEIHDYGIKDDSKHCYRIPSSS